MVVPVDAEVCQHRGPDMARLFGRYEYRGELGRGASGRVFAVLDHATLEHGVPVRHLPKLSTVA